MPFEKSYNTNQVIETPPTQTQIAFQAHVSELRMDVATMRELAAAAGLHPKDDALLVAVLLKRIELQLDTISGDVRDVESAVNRS